MSKDSVGVVAVTLKERALVALRVRLSSTSMLLSPHRFRRWCNGASPACKCQRLPIYTYVTPMRMIGLRQ